MSRYTANRHERPAKKYQEVKNEKSFYSLYGGALHQAFIKNCAVCHADGGNIINPAKSIHKKALEASGVKKPADIIRQMRNPGPGMTKFDEKTIPDKEARAIAEYILKTFKRDGI